MKYLPRKTKYLSFDQVSAAEWVFQKSLNSFEIFSFLLILSYLFVWRFMLQRLPNICSFLSLHVFWWFVDWVVLFLLFFLFFLLIHYSYYYFSITNSISISWLKILTICISFQFLFVFGKNFHIVPALEVIQFVFWFCEYISSFTFFENIVQWHHYYSLLLFITTINYY